MKFAIALAFSLVGYAEAGYRKIGGGGVFNSDLRRVAMTLEQAKGCCDDPASCIALSFHDDCAGFYRPGSVDVSACKYNIQKYRNC